jgi:hypothetical protein
MASNPVAIIYRIDKIGQASNITEFISSFLFQLAMGQKPTDDL